MTEFKSRAVRSLVELQDREMRAFLETWKRFKASGKPMPEAHGDESYQSPERLMAHVLGAARGYIMWMTDQIGRQITEVQRAKSPDEVLADPEAFHAATIAAWNKHAGQFTDTEIEKPQYKTRFGDWLNLEQALEHAVVHPMRHRIQLERILEG